MKITLKDGSVMEFEQEMSVLDVAKSISEGLARVATSAKVDGDIVDLRTVLDKDCELEILTFDSENMKVQMNSSAENFASYKYVKISADMGDVMYNFYIYPVQNNVYDLEGLKRFDKLGYKYSQEKSNENTYVFIKY